MPSTFLQAKTELLEFAKRPVDSEWLPIAGGAINEAVVKLQRLIPNMSALSKVVGSFAYPANTDKVDYQDLDVATDINKVISVELTEGGSLVGLPLRCYTYNQLALDRANFEQLKVANETYEAFTTHESYISNTHKHYAIVLGTDLMLYPKPGVDVELALHYTQWLPTLVDDTDTNVLLKYCWDFIFYASLFRMNVLLSESDRIEVSNVALNYALNEARVWNSSLDYSNPIDA